MTIYILGGGPAGLALAHGLTQDSAIPFALLERGRTVGGLAQTIGWGEHGCHDLGPHKIFTLDQDLMARVEGLLSPSAWLTRPKKSEIFMHGRFLSYPPSPFSLLGIYGPMAFTGMVVDYGSTRLRALLSKPNAATFAEDLEGRVGRRLYEALFQPIALKLWGDPTQLDAKLSQGRVQIPSLFELIARLLKLRNSSDFEALEFRYPRGGLQNLWDAVVTKTQHQGHYLLNQEVTAIEVEDGAVRTIRYTDRQTHEDHTIETGEDDFVFSTLPIGRLIALMGHAITASTTALVQEVVQLNDLLLVFLKVDTPSLLESSWVFVPDPSIIFHRVSEQESFDPDMTPGGSIVCCEIMSNETRPMSQRSDEELIEAAQKGLSDMGYTGFSVLDQRIIRLPTSYPIFRPGFEPALSQILVELDRFSNFRTIGRQGAFNYIGSLDAMDIGYGAARWAIRQSQAAAPIWQAERERTNHYPVLD